MQAVLVVDLSRPCYSSSPAIKHAHNNSQLNGFQRTRPREGNSTAADPGSGSRVLLATLLSANRNTVEG